MKDVPNWGKKILPIVLPPMVEAENFSDHLRIYRTFTLFIPCIATQLLQLKPTTCTLVIIQFYKTTYTCFEP
jgi:hypothetical protein